MRHYIASLWKKIVRALVLDIDEFNREQGTNIQI